MALFIFGMKVMSDGIQKSAGGQLRLTLRNVTKNPINALLVGVVTTGILQSSSATTVMIISFVNAGLITSIQSVGLIMGANIGTTITAWLVSLGGFLFKLDVVALPLLVLAVPLYLGGRKKHKYWAEFLIGFCLLFIGLDFLKSSVPSVEDQEVFNLIKDYTSLGFASRILFVAIGFVLTLVVQSSSAAITLTLALVFAGLLPLDLACAMIIGENIGTTITAEIAALVANVYARQSASVHTLFNVIGALWMIILLGPIVQLIEEIFILITADQEAFSSPRIKTLGLAAFHTLFNVMNTLILLPFAGYLVKIAAMLRKKRSKKDTRMGFRYKQGRIGTPELSAMEIKSELGVIGHTVVEMVKDTHLELNSLDASEQKSIHKKLIKRDDKNTALSENIQKYVIKIAREELTLRTSDSLQRYLTISANLTRISNLCVTISLELKDKSKQQIWFTPDQRQALNKLFDKINMGLVLTNQYLNDTEPLNVDIEAAKQIEKEINRLRDKYRKGISKTTGNYDFNMDGTLIYFRIFTLLEKIGDKSFEICATLSQD